MKKAPQPKRETKLNPERKESVNIFLTILILTYIKCQINGKTFIIFVSKQCQNSVKTMSKQFRFHTECSSGQKNLSISLLSLAEYPHKIVESASIASFLLRKYDL